MNYEQIKQIVENSVSTILDIGAHMGEFTKGMRQVMPFADYHMIEANPECEEHLKEVGLVPYTIALLSDTPRNLHYYVNKQDRMSTGNSYYKELTQHYSDDNLVQLEMQSQTLDKIFPNKSFDLIKIDTQGSELDILKGGSKLVSKAAYLIVECSVKPYNEGAPLISEVIAYMDTIGFVRNAIVGEHYLDDALFQQDILFKKIK